MSNNISNVLFDFEAFILQVNCHLKSNFEIRYDNIRSVSVYDEYSDRRTEYVKIDATYRYFVFSIEIQTTRDYACVDINWGKLSRGYSETETDDDFCFVLLLNDCIISSAKDLVDVLPTLKDVCTNPIFSHEKYNCHFQSTTEYNTFPRIYPYEEYNGVVLQGDTPNSVFAITTFRDIYVDPLFDENDPDGLEDESYDIHVFTITKRVYIKVYYYVNNVADQCQLCYLPNTVESIRTRCNHSFHAVCLNAWLSKTRACPCCLADKKQMVVDRYRVCVDVNDCCAICMSDMNKDTVNTVLLCDHAFHSTCASYWFCSEHSQEKCPLCRRRV